MNRLKYLREERKYSVRELEKVIGIGFDSISKYENEARDPNTKTLKKLADFYEVSIDYILCYSDCYVYCNYEITNFRFKIRDKYYNELKEKNYIYFKDDKRYLDINKLLHQRKNANLLPLLVELSRVDKMNSLFDRSIVSFDEFGEILNKDATEIEITKEFIKFVIEAIS